MAKFFNKVKKPALWSIFGPFPKFGDKNFFLENLALPCTTSYGFLTPCQNLGKINDIVQRKHPGRMTEGQMDEGTDPI